LYEIRDPVPADASSERYGNVTETVTNAFRPGAKTNRRSGLA
jgi:hypothetical protein